MRFLSLNRGITCVFGSDVVLLCLVILCICCELYCVCYIVVGKCMSVLFPFVFGVCIDCCNYRNVICVNCVCCHAVLLYIVVMCGDGVIVAGWAGQTKRCLISCGVMLHSAQTLRLASFLILILYEPRSPQYPDVS